MAQKNDSPKRQHLGQLLPLWAIIKQKKCEIEPNQFHTQNKNKLTDTAYVFNIVR